MTTGTACDACGEWIDGAPLSLSDGNDKWDFCDQACLTRWSKGDNAATEPDSPDE